MAIAYRSGASGGNGTGTDVTVTKPSGTVDNDILIAVLYREAGTWTLPSGWSWLITDYANYNNTAWVGVAWKRASSEGSSYVFQLSTSTWRVVSIGAFSGATTSGNPFDASKASNASAFNEIFALSISTGAANELAVILTGTFEGDNPTPGSSGYTAGQMLGGCGLLYKTWASAGATGNISLTRSGASSGDWVAHHVALIPDTGGGGGELSISYFGSASTPVDSSTATNITDPTVVTPPASMLAGDLVVMIAQSRATSGTLAISQAGGQTWTSLAQHDATTCRRRIFWCRFNGTWSANPSVTMGGTTCNTVVMHVFRPSSAVSEWLADVGVTDGTYAAPASPYTVTITGVTIGAAPALALACWHSIDDNTWGSLAGSGWVVTGGAQYRNTSGSDQSSTYAHYIGTGATGNVSKNQLTLGGDAGATSILSWRLVAPITGGAAVALDGVGLSATGTVAAAGINGSLAATLEGVGLNTAGIVALRGTSSATLSGIGLTSAGTVTVVGGSTTTLGGIGLSTAGTVAVVGACAVTLGGIGLTAAGAVAAAGTLTRALDSISLICSGVVGSVPISGALTATLGGIGVSAVGTVAIRGQSAPTLGGIGASSSGIAAVAGGLAQALEVTGLNSAGVVPVTGGISATLLGQELSGIGLAASGHLAIVGMSGILCEDVSVAAGGSVRDAVYLIAIASVVRRGKTSTYVSRNGYAVTWVEQGGSSSGSV